jgi:hypothetical protein
VAGEAVTPDLSPEDGVKSSILFLERHKKSASILLKKRWVEGASKVSEDKTFTNEARKVSIVSKE